MDLESLLWNSLTLDEFMRRISIIVISFMWSLEYDAEAVMAILMDLHDMIEEEQNSLHY